VLKTALTKALFGLLACMAFSQASFSQAAFQVGVGIHLNNAPNNSASAITSAIQGKGLSIRTDASWGRIEASKGNLAWPKSLDDLDRLVDTMVASHLRPVVILDYGNQFYDEGGQVYSPDGVAAYVRYALFVVNHFKGRVDQFEVWNEWSHGTGTTTGNKKGDAGQYIALLRASYKAIKAQSPNVVVIGGVTGSGSKDTAWTQQFVALGGLDFLDAFSMHPYVHCDGGIIGMPVPGAPTNVEGKTSALFDLLSSAVPTASADSAIQGGSPEESIAQVDAVHAQFGASRPSRDIPIYITEIGWPTSIGQCGIPNAAQATNLQRFMLLARARPFIAGVWWYDLFDDGVDPRSRENRFGVMALDRGAKVAYTHLVGIVSLLQSSKVTQSTGSDGEIIIKGQGQDGKTWYAAWLPSNNYAARRNWTLGAQLLHGGYHLVGAAATAADVAVSASPIVVVQD
jgi:polysaccharide biosynthesis protein PslG